MAKRNRKQRRAIVKNTADSDISQNKDGAALFKKKNKKPSKKRMLLEEDNKDHKSDNQKSWGTNSVKDLLNSQRTSLNPDFKIDEDLGGDQNADYPNFQNNRVSSSNDDSGSLKDGELTFMQNQQLFTTDKYGFRQKSPSKAKKLLGVDESKANYDLKVEIDKYHEREAA